MKVTKWVDIPSMEIEVHISGEDAVQAVLDDPGEGWTMEARIKQLVNGMYGFFKHVSDEHIATLTEPARRIIATAFHEQAERFWPTPKTEGRTFDAAVDRVIARVDKGLEGKS